MKFKQLSILALLLPFHIYAQFNVSGFVFDGKTGETLIGANITLGNKFQGASSNEFGYFHLKVDSGWCKLNCSFVGYASNSLKLYVKEDTIINFYLEPGFELKVHTVKAANQLTNSTEAGVVSMNSKQMRMITSLTGETDVLKSLQMMPGISGGKENSANILVRGGNADENLILLDDVPMYYTGHLGGFTSIFDESAVKSIKAYKGGFPARYGERLSSVVDIRTKDGNMYEHEGEVQVGTLVSKLALNGPLMKDRTSYLLSFRMSNLNWFLMPVTYTSFDGNGYMSYNFYDLNFKLNHRFSNKDRFYLMYYWGGDKLNVVGNETDEPKSELKFDYKSKQKIKWGNNVTSFRWNHIFNDNLFMNFTLARLKYNYQKKNSVYVKVHDTNNDAIASLLTYDSNVLDYMGKVDLNWYIANRHKIKNGVSVTNHYYNPSAVNYSLVYDTTVLENDYYREIGSPSNQLINDRGLEVKAMEYNVYGEYIFSLGHYINSNFGCRFSAYQTSADSYYSIQPRISTSIRVSKNVSIKTSYSKMQQYVHLLSSDNDGGLPSDVWMPVGGTISPAESDQYTLGVFGEKSTSGWSFYIDTYYKILSELIEFKSGENLFDVNTDWQSKIETGGSGEVFGAEFFLRKETKKLDCWLGYTISSNKRQFENINDGEPYSAKFDRLHDFEIVANYKLNDNISVSATWVYASGIYQTLGTYKSNGLSLVGHESYLDGEIYKQYYENDIFYYGKKNNFQYPAYHRLDLGVSFKKQKKYGIRTLTLGVVNAYNRLNPYTVYYTKDANGKTQLEQKAMFPLLPSLSYKYAFKKDKNKS